MVIENRKHIEETLPHTNINIEISNISFDSTEKEFIDYVQNKFGLNIKKYDMPQYYGKKHKGKCIIIFETKEEALKLLNLNGMVNH